mgnify:CR=1 FL=1
MTLARAVTCGNVRTVRNATGAELWLYDEIGPWGTTASDVAAALSQVPTDRVTVRVNSPGGSVFDGIAIYNLLRGHAGGVDVVKDVFRTGKTKRGIHRADLVAALELEEA